MSKLSNNPCDNSNLTCCMFSPDGEQEALSSLLSAYSEDGAIVMKTENVDGIPYFLAAENADVIKKEWDGDCNGLPENDARVFALWVGGERRELDDDTAFEDVFVSLLS